MALLDSILGSLLGGGQSSSPLGSILGGLLGGGGGGLSSLLQRLEQAGLGNIAQSWVQNGPNQSISPQDLQKVFHPHELEQMSQQSGMPQGDILSQLSQMLPQAVDHMTPGGQIPKSDGSDPFAGEGTGSIRV